MTPVMLQSRHGTSGVLGCEMVAMEVHWGSGCGEGQRSQPWWAQHSGGESKSGWLREAVKPRERDMAESSCRSEQEPKFIVGSAVCPLLDVCPVSYSAVPLRWPNCRQ